MVVRAKSGHRGPHGARFREIAENGPKIQKIVIFRDFSKNPKTYVLYYNLSQNVKFWGPGTKNDHFRAKNVIFLGFWEILIISDQQI